MSGPIDWLTHPRFRGRIGITHCPGGRGIPLARDLEAIGRSGATALVTLVEQDELEALGLAGLQGLMEKAGIDWYHLPIVDYGVPDQRFEERWREHGPALRARLEAGEDIVIHCYAGLGRSGIVAARLLVDCGEPPERAIALVRRVRQGAIQNDEQEAYVRSLRPVA